MKFTKAEFFELLQEFAPQEAEYLRGQTSEDYPLPEETQQTLRRWVYGYPWWNANAIMHQLTKKLDKLQKATITFDAHEIVSLGMEMEPSVTLTPMQVIRVMRLIESKANFEEGLHWDAIREFIREVAGYDEEE